MRIFSYLITYQDWAPFALRIALGAAFLVHGYPKLFKNFSGFAGWLETIGIKPGRFWASVVGVVEFFGGIAIVLGVFTQLAAFLIAVNMVVAMAKVKWGAAKFVETERMGWELDLAYLAMAAALVLWGPGAYTIEAYFFRG